MERTSNLLLLRILCRFLLVSFLGAVAVLPLVSVCRLLVGIPTIWHIRGVFGERAGLDFVQLVIASYTGSTVEIDH
jgi:hypothetical protein